MSTYPNSPSKLPRLGLAFVALCALLGQSVVHRFPERHEAPASAQKLLATERAQRAFDLIAQRAPPAPPGRPLRAGGLVGHWSSSITSDRGYLQAKIASANPHFAAAIVEMLRRARVRTGDLVAVALSGSFPALNICVHTALQACGVEGMFITSAAASNWGANDPRFTWLDMEHELVRAGVLSSPSHLVSIGGDGDRGGGLPSEGVSLLREKIKRYHLPELRCSNSAQSRRLRLAFYRSQSQGRPIKAYINIGGGVASVRRYEKYLFNPGVNLGSLQVERSPSDSIMAIFARRGIPVIHLVKIRELARTYGFANAEEGTGQPLGLYQQTRYSPSAAGAILVILLIGLWRISRSQRAQERALLKRVTPAHFEL